jgi:hypothetical protein
MKALYKETILLTSPGEPAALNLLILVVLFLLSPILIPPLLVIIMILAITGWYRASSQGLWLAPLLVLLAFVAARTTLFLVRKARRIGSVSV